MKELLEEWLGDYQKWILYILYTYGNKFLTDFESMTKLRAGEISSCLRTLVNRSLVSISKEYNPNTKNSRKLNNKYAITSKGTELLAKNFEFNQYRLNEIQSKLRKISDNYSSINKNSVAVRNTLYFSKNQELILQILK